MLCAGLCLALIVVPLRLVSESLYQVEPQKLDAGVLTVALDPTFFPRPSSYWFDGLEGKSPYRIRFIFQPSTAKAKEFRIDGFAIKDATGKVLVECPSKIATTRDRDENGREVLIVGYLDIPLTTEEVTMELPVQTAGNRYPVHLRLKRATERHIVHAGLEAIMGI